MRSSVKFLVKCVEVVCGIVGNVNIVAETCKEYSTTSSFNQMWDPSMCFETERISPTIAKSTENFGLTATVALPKYCKLTLEFRGGWLNAIAMVDPSQNYAHIPVPHKMGNAMKPLRKHWETADFVKFKNDKFGFTGLVDIVITPSQLHATFAQLSEATKKDFSLTGFPPGSQLAVGTYRGNEVHILHCEAML
eukprot:PhF_6_TR11037/c0_g1_i1/m.17896